MHAGLHNLMLWSSEWKMLFNIDNCEVSYLGYNNPETHYVMKTTQLQAVSEESDLGVIVSADLKWEKQCTAAVKKANKILGMIKRNFVDRSKETVMAPYTFRILHTVWNPHLPKDIKLVEGVQLRATKLVQGIGNLQCDERLRYLGLTRLEKNKSKK